MKRCMMLFAVLFMLCDMGITAQASGLGESEQSAEELSGLADRIPEEQRQWISDFLEAPDEVIAFVKEKLAAGELETDEDIEKAIEEGEEKFDASLTEEDKEKILQLVQKVKKLGIDPEKLMDQVLQAGDDWANQAQEAVKQTMKSSVSGFFQDVGKRIKGFFDTIFS